MISINKRFRPFSHAANSCLLPGTNLIVKASPDALEIGILKIPLGMDPFAKGFTLQQDLEKNCVFVFGKGVFLRVFAKKEGIVVVSKGDRQFFPMETEFFIDDAPERICLGSHKALDWDLTLRKMDIRDILPSLFLLSQKVPLNEGEKNEETIERFYQTSFDNMLVPKRKNALKGAFGKIRSLFLLEDGNRIDLLPNNPFACGRMIGAKTQFGTIDMQWTKGTLKKAVLHVRRKGEVLFNMNSFRVRTSLHDRGNVHRGPILLESPRLYLDRFNEYSDR